VTSGVLNPLVGVAISASLLPPISNSGLCFVLGIATSGSQSKDLLRVAGVSISLWVVNILAIVFVAWFFFRMKEINAAGHRRRSSNFRDLDKPHNIGAEIALGSSGIGGSGGDRSGLHTDDTSISIGLKPDHVSSSTHDADPYAVPDNNHYRLSDSSDEEDGDQTRNAPSEVVVPTRNKRGGVPTMLPAAAFGASLHNVRL
jgi:Domain of unknown function (DUF389)